MQSLSVTVPERIDDHFERRRVLSLARVVDVVPIKHWRPTVRYSPSANIDGDTIYGDNITGERAQWLTAGVTVRF